jgi:hypothetical protein
MCDSGKMRRVTSLCICRREELVLDWRCFRVESLTMYVYTSLLLGLLQCCHEHSYSGIHACLKGKTLASGRT